jgi:DNA modification methylase
MIKRKFDSSLKTKDLIGIPWMVAFALRADGWYLRQDIIWHKPNPMPESVTDRCTKAHEYIFLFSKSQKYHFDNEAIKEDAKYGVNGEDSRPAGVVREREYDYDSKRNNNPSAFMAKDKRAGKGRISYEGKRTIGEASANEQQSFVTINEKRNKRSVWTVTTKPYSGAHFATFPPDLIEPCILAGAPEGGIVLDPFMGSGTTAHTALRAGRQYVGCELNGEYIKLANKRLSQGFLL